MERYAIQRLIAWKNKASRKPLIIRGARQCGKTWLMKQFAKEAYRDSIYISFDENSRIEKIFEPDLNPRRIITELEMMYQKKIDPENTLLIFDEIQESKRALKSLKYFNEEADNYHIVCAGSLLGIALHPGTSFPVGKVEFMDLYPLSFPEFLRALDQKPLVQLVTEEDPENLRLSELRLFRHEYEKFLRYYFFVGGMPEAAAAFVRTGDFSEVQHIQQSIIDMYDQDFSKHAPGVQVPKIRKLWNSIPVQLAKENKKFSYRLISDNARSREFESAMLWILDTGIAHSVHRVSDVKQPLKAYEEKAFKLYMCDIGLLSCMSGIDKDILFEGDELFVEFKGALTEQYVLQQLVSQTPYRPFYWNNEGARAEIDFLIQAGRHIVPVEVKAGINLRAKSLQVYLEKHKPSMAFRTSLADYKSGLKVIDLPLYAIGMLPLIVHQAPKPPPSGPPGPS
jgi:predicted AAA+ superfamily ATPase